MAINLFSRKQQGGSRQSGRNAEERKSPRDRSYKPSSRQSLSDDPLERIFQQKRFGVLAANAARFAEQANGKRICAAAERSLEDCTALVPEGVAAIAQSLNDGPDAPENEVNVAPYLLCIHTVTNGEFQHFVDAQCYDELDLWPEEIWPHLIELHDQTNRPAPRYWVDARHDDRFSEHPVVGISWYEAAAYARWIGLRLPTEAEWQMAASWRIKSEADVYRRFPWGDAMDYRRCNIWGHGYGNTQPVEALEAGQAPNGVRQLIGNVWEWTASDFEVADEFGQYIVGEMPLKSIRGGAYDTYFDAQANAAFRTGLIVLARTHNVGFRCACDV